MSAISYSNCECCRRQFGFVLESALQDDGGKPVLCGMCRVRGRLCLHNIFERSAGREPGAPPVSFHSTVPHDGMMEFADDPSSCPACKVARERAAWLRREVL